MPSHILLQCVLLLVCPPPSMMSCHFIMLIVLMLTLRRSFYVHMYLNCRNKLLFCMKMLLCLDEEDNFIGVIACHTECSPLLVHEAAPYKLRVLHRLTVTELDLCKVKENRVSQNSDSRSLGVSVRGTFHTHLKDISHTWGVIDAYLRDNYLTNWTCGVSHCSFRRRGSEENYAPYCLRLIPGMSNWPLFVCVHVSERTASHNFFPLTAGERGW